MNERLDRWAPWALGAVAFVTCVAFMPDVPTEWDSVQLVLGVDDFDVTHDSPHPPGYWLYLLLARVVRLLTPLSTHASLSVLAAAAAGVAVGLTYVLGRRWGGPWLGTAAAAFLLTSPYLLFYGAFPATYTFDAAIAVALVLLATDARPGTWHGWVAAAVLGLAAGLRPTSLLLLGPLVLYAVLASVRSVRSALAVVGAGGATLLAWVVPMLLEQPGGLSRYREYSDTYFQNAADRSSILVGAPRNGVINNLAQVTGYTIGSVFVLLPVALVALVLFAIGWRTARAKQGRVAVLLWLSLLVPFLFFIVVHFGKGGYVLSYLPAMVLLLLWPASRLQAAPRAAVTVLVALACLLDFQRFVAAAGIIPGKLLDKESVWFTQQRHGAPYRLTRPTMETTDRETREYLALRREFDPAKDALVYAGWDGGHRFRHAGWTMPEFTMHLLQPGLRWTYQVGGVKHLTSDTIAPVPPGGRSVWVLDVPLDETKALEAQGRITRHTLATGPTVWIAPPGVTMFGVTVVEQASVR